MAPPKKTAVLVESPKSPGPVRDGAWAAPAPEPQEPASERIRKALSATKAKVLKQCLPLGLILAVIIALSAPFLGIGASSLTIRGQNGLQIACVWVIFIISGLTLKTDDVLAALTAWRAVGFGIVSILFITPLLAPLAGLIPLPNQPNEYSLGFIIFCAMPTTINSGVALAVQAKGSFAIALMLTVFTNIVAVFTMPFFLSLMLELGAVPLEPVALFVRLLWLILAPLALGKAVRELSSWVQGKVKAHKQQLSLFSNFCLILIPWMTISRSAASLIAAGGVSVLIVIAIGLAIHLCYLTFNFTCCKLILRKSDEIRSVTIMSSQKTLPVALAVIAALPAQLGEPGLMAIPCVVSHLVQILVDAWIVTRWANIPIHKDAHAMAPVSESDTPTLADAPASA